jgi:hypothetical protein
MSVTNKPMVVLLTKLQQPLLIEAAGEALLVLWHTMMPGH